MAKHIFSGFFLLSIVLVFFAEGAWAQPSLDDELRIMCVGAHPDDCDIKMGGTAALWAEQGHAVKFVSITNGNAGHQDMGGGSLYKRRYEEAEESARRLGIEYTVLNNDDATLEPTFEVREQVIEQIRDWEADVVIGHRPWDYHPDHRYSGVLVQDAAYLVQVPNVVPQVEALEHNPYFFYLSDHFEKPSPFAPDVVVAIDEVIDQKISALDAHESQMYEWLPWIGGFLDEVPEDEEERLEWLRGRRAGDVPAEWEDALSNWYGDAAGNVQHAEAFEICEYGSQPREEDLRNIFPTQ